MGSPHQAAGQYQKHELTPTNENNMTREELSSGHEVTPDHFVTEMRHLVF